MSLKHPIKTKFGLDFIHITGFESTFSQDCTSSSAVAQQQCQPAHIFNHNQLFTDPLPGSTTYNIPWPTQQQQYHQQRNQHYVTATNINNNASPTSYHGYERPNYGLVKQITEIFKLSGKLEMQPSEVYYELE